MGMLLLRSKLDLSVLSLSCTQTLSRSTRASLTLLGGHLLVIVRVSMCFVEDIDITYKGLYTTKRREVSATASTR